MAGEDLLDNLIEKIAEAVVRKIEEREKIDLIAQAVLARLEEQRGKAAVQWQGGGGENPPEVKRPTPASQGRTGKRTAVRRAKKQMKKVKRRGV